MQKIKEDFYAFLEDQLGSNDTFRPKCISESDISGKNEDLDSGFNPDDLLKIGICSVEIPEKMKVHPRLMKYHILGRVSKLHERKGIDWATAEALAFGSLLLDGYNIRISGQDVGRGTFSQRHAMLVDQETENTVIPLNQLNSHYEKTGIGKLEIANSSLSEFAVVGFEYGVTWEDPNRLCIWEAQFGDFFNGAQIIIDTYLSSGETKWGRHSGLVMLLPHGYDGGGPEHSSCRIERFLQLCDESFAGASITKQLPNMCIVNPTTPAQYFHVLRRQMLRGYRKPLIVVGPKLLLRHPAAISSFTEMISGTKFLPVIDDLDISNAQNVKRVCFVSGKLYYDLVKDLHGTNERDQYAFVRLEELCPFPHQNIVKIIQKYSSATEWLWIQEEPQNMGAYSYAVPRIEHLLPHSARLRYIGRKPEAAPATGIGKIHSREHKELVSFWKNLK